METLDAPQPKVTDTSGLVKHAIRSGGILGLITVVITVVAYIVDYGWIVNMWYGLGLLLLSLGFIIYSGITFRNEVGGYLPYGKAFQHTYLTFLVAGLIGTVFSLLLYTVIDPELPAKLTDVAVENAEVMMAKFGAPPDQIDKQLDQMREDMPARFSALGVAKQFGWSILIYGVLALIFALFIKKNPPEVF